jgi:RNA polymerase subunit RPABC4/transcription elongation factor Spt4
MLSFSIPPLVITILEGICIALGAYFVIFWFAMVAWTFQDIRRRTHDWMMQILSLLMVLCFHVAGLIVYLIIRPQDTLAMVEGRAVEEQALLQSMEEKLSCPNCHKPILPDFAVCPYCGDQLKNQCSACDRLLAMNWTVCPYCGTAVKPAEPIESETHATPELPAPAAEPLIEAASPS